VRRRFVSSEGARSDERRSTLRIDAVAETQAPDGMRLVNFVPFTALSLAGLPPAAEMEKAVRRMAAELVALRSAPVAASGTASVLFEGPAAAQLAKLLLGDHLAGTPAPRTAAGGEERGQTSELAGKLGQKVAAALLDAVDDPLVDLGPGKAPLFGAYRVDDEGITAQRVVLLEGGVLRGLLMTRTPRKEIAQSNGHARGPRFSPPHASVGNLFLTPRRGVAKGGLARAALLAEMARAARGGGLGSYVVRLLEEPTVPGTADPDEGMAMCSMTGGGGRSAPVKPLLVYRIKEDGKNGVKEELVRGLTLEGLVPRSLKDIVAMGREPTVYNFHDGGAGLAGVPTSIVTPALLLADVEVRRSVGRNRKPPLYPRPELK
jgi:TldD protein